MKLEFGRVAELSHVACHGLSTDDDVWLQRDRSFNYLTTAAGKSVNRGCL